MKIRNGRAAEKFDLIERSKVLVVHAKGSPECFGEEPKRMNNEMR